jgi:RND family efflux transporter MFP subunit
MTSAVKIAQDKVNYTSLQAPFSGEVVATYVENFETVLPKQPVLRLLDPSSIEFVINVPENLISHAAHVREVSVSFEALPGVDVPATIKEIGREASSATRTYPVTLLMTQPEGAEILPGMAGTASVNALLPAAARDSGINIPATAVFSQDDPKKSYVWIIDPTSKALVSREVETGNLTETGLLIRSGLKPGDWLVTKGVHSITEGQLVRILDLSGEGA